MARRARPDPRRSRPRPDSKPVRARAPRTPSPAAPTPASPETGRSAKEASSPAPTDVILKPPRLPGPWVYRRMLRFPEVPVTNGAYVALRDRHGKLRGHGFFNRRSEIAFRLVAGPEGPADVDALFALRLRQALSLRQDVLGLGGHERAFRLVHGEGDDLSGLVVDVYGSTAVCALYSQGYVANAPALERALLALPGITRVLFIQDDRAAELEGFRLPPLPPGLSETVREGPVVFEVDLSSGHKTGLFLDQRDNRARLRQLAKGRRVLDLATNAGGFALAAAAGRAKKIVAVDLDEEALGRARNNARRNRARIDFVHADLFPWLRGAAKRKETFDVVVLDPAKLAKDASEVEAALETYREMNAAALRVVAPGGLLLTFSCSGSVREGQFLGAVRRGFEEAGRRGRIVSYLGAAPDHPVALDFPEGRYLKGALLHVT